MLTGQIFIQLIIILLAVQVFGYLGQLVGQPKVIGEILAGLALGPTLLGAVLPRAAAAIFPSSALPTLQTLGDIGMVIYMFSLGTHIDTRAMLKHGRKAAVVSLSGVLLPLALGAAFAFFLYPQFAGAKANLLSFMLLVGTAMASRTIAVAVTVLLPTRLATMPTPASTKTIRQSTWIKMSTRTVATAKLVATPNCPRSRAPMTSPPTTARGKNELIASRTNRSRTKA